MKNHIINGAGVTICIAVLTGCTAPQGVPSETAPVQTPQKEISSPAHTFGQKNISLKANNFPGEITLSSAQIQKTETGIRIPVFLNNVSKADIVDTVTLEMNLPETMKLVEVVTPTGFTAELDGIETDKPIVYYHPFSITAGSYTPVVASQEPLFTMIFDGTFQQPITFSGSFFQTSGVLLRTKKESLSP